MALRSIRWHDQRLTRNWRVWLQYLCWCVQFWMMFHKPTYPERFRLWVLRRYGMDRFSASERMIAWWKEIDPSFVLPHHKRPLPWWLGEHALGPFLKPWNNAQHFLRAHTGGRSHRCEFTDPDNGALYGGEW